MAKEQTYYTKAEVRQILAKNLREKVAAATAEIEGLRKRELRRSALGKSELCVLCAQLPKACTCLAKATVEEVNHEMKGFRSLGTNGTFGGGKLVNPPKTAPRSGNGNRAVSGVISNAKGEPAASGGSADGKRKKVALPGLVKPKKVNGDEGSGNLTKRDITAAPGTAPAAAPPKIVGVGGKQPVGQGGGDAHKVPHPETTASLADVKALAPKVAGADAWKQSGLPKLRAALASNKAKPPHPETAAGLADVKALAPKVAASTVGQRLAATPAKPAGIAAAKAPHPETAAGLADVKALAPKVAGTDAWKQGGLPKLRAQLAAVAANKAPAAAPAAASTIGQRPAATPAKPAGNPVGNVAQDRAQLAADKRAGGVGFLNNLISQFGSKKPAARAQLAADKRAGGVGFLNNLISQFGSKKPAASMPTPGMEPAGVRGGPVQSKRFHGATPLLRGEPSEKKDLDANARAHIKGKNFAIPSAGKKKPGSYPVEDKRHAVAALGLVGMHGSPEEKAKVRAKVHAKYPNMGKGEPTPKRGAFALGKCAMCSKSEHGGLCKMDPGAPTEGLSAMNHNRTMLRIGSTKGRRGVKRSR